jgi:hypothetical protein
MPNHYFDADTRDTVKVGTGLIATMSALVVGLITASAKSAFDAMDSAVTQSAIKALSLDRLLARYGSETQDVRRGLQQAIAKRVDVLWPSRSTLSAAETSDAASFSEAE